VALSITRGVGEKTIAAYLAIRASARANRAFLTRTVRYLATHEGICQFLDIGTGLPTANNTHEVAQSVAPTSRIAYVDNDHCKWLARPASESAIADGDYWAVAWRT
jgi:hypothetical protein